MRILFFAVCLQTAATLASGQLPAQEQGRQQQEQAQMSTLQQQRESLVKQQQSIQRQLGEITDAAPGLHIAGIDPFPALAFHVTNLAACPAIDRETMDALIAPVAKKHSLSPALLRAVIRQESGFHPCAVSFRGAQGLMQLMPGTAQQLRVSDPFDPTQNIQGGAAFLRQLLTRYAGDLRTALAAYNAGPVRADQGEDRPLPFETQNYIANIFADLGLSDDASVDASKIPNPVPANNQPQ